jgi:hypothetical protein
VALRTVSGRAPTAKIECMWSSWPDACFVVARAGAAVVGSTGDPDVTTARGGRAGAAAFDEFVAGVTLMALFPSKRCIPGHRRRRTA